MPNPARQIFDQQVLPLFEQSRTAWLANARATARYLARKNGQVNINDVRAECPPPDGVDPRCMGAVFSGKDFIRIGYIDSSRRQCHGRPIAVFSLKASLTQTHQNQP